MKTVTLPPAKTGRKARELPARRRAAACRQAQMGFIGAGGFITAHHLHTAAHSRRMSMRAICDLDQKRLASHQKEFSPGYITADYRQVLDDPAVDIVVIGTKQDLHAKFIIEALDAGKWVFCEKPIAETAAETEAVLAAERRARGRLAVGFNRRFAPAYARVKRLLATQRPPIFINYRLMYPNPQKTSGYYAGRERIVYEGTHILDLVCWLLDAAPTTVYMTGDRYRNNICVLEFPRGSRVSFLCGSMGSYLLWKEYLEVFTAYTAITVSDFVDMRVRGFPGEFDEVFPAHLGEQGRELRAHGFDFYEACKSQEALQTIGDMPFEAVRRPVREFGPRPFRKQTDYRSSFVPDKGWVQSLEHFATCFLKDEMPGNADGRAGARANQIAFRALESLEARQALAFAGRAT
ncbi:MAG: Gfo/Idh/MocA family oxidoreductase [Verrucomicrobiae bacterium]|nr:Gfo/Idh/MocA family oxidoreductase [Verrucomicrobiae bacterium]